MNISKPFKYFIEQNEIVSISSNYSMYEEKLFHFVSMVQYGAIMLSENLLIIGTFLFYKQHKALAMGIVGKDKT